MAALDGEEEKADSAEMRKKLLACRKAIGSRLAYDGLNAKEDSK